MEGNSACQLQLYKNEIQAAETTKNNIDKGSHIYDVVWYGGGWYCQYLMFMTYAQRGGGSFLLSMLSQDFSKVVQSHDSL